jgi:hypothetical protein
MLKTRQHIGYAAFIARIMLRTATAKAKPLAAPVTQSCIQFVVSGQNDSVLRLEARQARLGKIFKEIAAQTGTIIHNSVLPEAPVTATSACGNIWQLMDCPDSKKNLNRVPTDF